MESILEMFDLNGKNAVITGGSGVLGIHISRGLGKAGAKIIICSIKNAEKVAREIRDEGIDAKGYLMDVLNKDDIKKCHSQIMNDFGKIDILVNAAGGNMKEATTSPELSFFDMKFEGLEKVIMLNLFGGAIFPCQIFGKSMASNSDGGSIINVSSMSAFRPLTNVPGYSAAKAAVSNFTQWLAVHFAFEYNKNIRVNAIAPGFFSTKQNEYLLYDKNGNLSERGQKIISHTPIGRFGKSDELIGTCIWLASNASKFVTGVVVPIDGGFNAYSGV